MSVDDSVNVGNVTIGNGTTTLGARVGIKGSGSTSATTSLLVQNSSGGNLLQVKDNGLLTSNVDNEGGAFSIDVDTNAQTTLKLKPFGNNFNAAYQATIYNNYGNLVIKSAAYGNVTTELFGNGQYKITDNFAYNYLTVYGANVGGKSVFGRPVEIKGTGSTSATTSLLVQNSAGTTALKITDDSSLNFATNMKWTWTGGASSKNMFMNDSASGWGGFIFNSSLTYSGNTNELLVIATTKNAFKLPLAIGVALNPNDNLPLMSDSAVLQADSTTQGLLKPRMTTTQKNAISSPAAGLEVFDTTLGRPCFYSGSAWVTL
jgi:hypothetical protein